MSYYGGSFSILGYYIVVLYRTHLKRPHDVASLKIDPSIASHPGGLLMSHKPITIAVSRKVPGPRRRKYRILLLGLIACFSACLNTTALPQGQWELLDTTTAEASDLTKQIYLPTILMPKACIRPYSASSPWNTKIAQSPTYDPLSAGLSTVFSGIFGSDPTQYTMPVYEIDADTPTRIIHVSGYFSWVIDNDSRIVNQRATDILAPIPVEAVAPVGDDAQIVAWNPQTGDEWGFSRMSPNTDGTWNASSGYHYNTRWDGVPPLGKPNFASRGAGVPFLVGLVRPCEFYRGYINHAIAFAYDYPTKDFVYPATRSDGSSSGPPDLPEGARLQLDPTLTDAQIIAWGCTDACLVIAHAMQEYGMIIVDKSGRPKIFVEYEATATWGGYIKARTISKIPYSALRVLHIK
jgi:hypothetical protein